MDSRACSRPAATFVSGGTLPLRRAQSVRNDARRNQRVCCMDYNEEGCQGFCAELFALCRNDSWRQSVKPSVYAATCDKAKQNPAFRPPLHWVVKRREVYILLLNDDLSSYL
jgi:hypothetical protein